MRTSETTGALSDAIAKAQAELKNPPKNKINPHFKSKYADLSAILETILPIYAKFGIAIIQGTAVTETGIILTTRVSFKNEWIENDYPVCQFASPQQQMSALTYAKRAALQVTGLVCGDDDLDGEDSKDVKTDVRQAKPRPTMLDQEASSVLMQSMIASLKECNTRDKLLSWAQKNSDAKQTLIEAHQRRINAEFSLVQDALKTVKEAA